MVVRNSVPSLKILALRQLIFPRKNIKTKKCSCFGNKNPNSLTGRKIETKELKSIANLFELITNAWIRLIDYYKGDFKEINKLSGIFYYSSTITNSPIEALDFLHEGFCLRSGREILHISGYIPKTLNYRPLDPQTSWKELYNLLNKTDCVQNIKFLCIAFQNSNNSSGKNSKNNNNKIKSKKKSKKYKKNEINPDQSSLDKNSLYKSIETSPFKNTFGFENLTKLVIREGADDPLIGVIASNCNLLEHLDISCGEGKNRVTEDGIILLLFKENSKFFIREVPTSNRVIPREYLNELTLSLEYLDISSIKRREIEKNSHPLRLFNIDRYDKLILRACPNLTATPHRFFLNIPGMINFKIKFDRKKFETEFDYLNRIKMKFMNLVKSPIYERISRLLTRIQFDLLFGFDKIEIRRLEEEKKMFLGIYKNVDLIFLFEMKDKLWSKLTVFLASNLDFIALEILSDYCPSLKHIKAPLKGKAKRMFLRLTTLTTHCIHNVDTLKSILRSCSALEYLEVDEILLARSHLNNQEIERIFQFIQPKNHLQAIRFLFKNSIGNLGLKVIIKKCPLLRVVGDLKFWNISQESVNKIHKVFTDQNADFMIEYNGVVYHTRTPCREFYR